MGLEYIQFLIYSLADGQIFSAQLIASRIKWFGSIFINEFFNSNGFTTSSNTVSIKYINKIEWLIIVNIHLASALTRYAFFSVFTFPRFSLNVQ